MSNKRPILLIGGGGHCASVIDVIESQGIYKIMGIVDKKSFIGKFRNRDALWLKFLLCFLYSLYYDCN